jgi:hypothetical protein
MHKIIASFVSHFLKARSDCGGRLMTLPYGPCWLGECEAKHVGSGPGMVAPALVDGIMPCCGGGCHPDGGPCWGLAINCTSGQIDVARHNLSGYAPFLQSGRDRARSHTRIVAL